MQNAPLTPEANRAARAILRWSVRDLAEKAGIAFTTVHRFEQTGTATETTKAKIVAAYALHNVDITNGEGTGARLRKPAAPDHNLSDGEARIIENNEM
jgi:transcriptional regulator with XRE-family HTH domain